MQSGLARSLTFVLRHQLLDNRSKASTYKRDRLGPDASDRAGQTTCSVHQTAGMCRPPQQTRRGWGCRAPRPHPASKCVQLVFALWSCHKTAILRQACNAVASSIMDLYGHSSERTCAGVTASPPSPVSRAADTLPCKIQSMACAAWPLVLHWATHHLDTALVAAVHCGACSDACTRANPPLGPRF